MLSTMRFITLGLLVLTASAYADPVVHAGAARLDRPTFTALGVVLPITGDDNYNANVTLRYRKTGTTAWNSALPLLRVRPETVAGRTVESQFAGSVFDLRPGTAYDLELRLTDPDGSVNQVVNLSANTRRLPAYPVNPRYKTVSSPSQLASTLNGAQAGDVITIPNGTYNGSFFAVYQSGTPDNPIVIRGESQDGTILDGNNCWPCNVLEIYGNYVYVERMTLRNAERGLRFQGAGSTGNVLRRVTIRNTELGIGVKIDQTDFYIADNTFEGQLTWPAVWSDDNGRWGNRDGIVVAGKGHVVAHNRISGYGDSMKIGQDGSRAIDFYGNDVLWGYDNGIELDGGEGNVRALRNRFTNIYSPLSVQPVYGGPAYMIRNIGVNVVDEQMKFHGAPSGVLAYNNTFVSRYRSLLMNTEQPSYNYTIENNLFVGPDTTVYGHTVDWSGLGSYRTFNYNAYYPNAVFTFNTANGYQNYPNFSALQAAGWETNGTLLSRSPFANGLVGPVAYNVLLPPQDVTLAGNSEALNRALVLPNVSDSYSGSAPDLGALELGCPSPIFGPRPEGTDESNEPFGCTNAPTPTPEPATVQIAVSPTAATVAAGASQQFTASVTGTTNTAVTWTVSGPGTITPGGLYTAPATVDTAQTVSVKATSAADPSKVATATVSLTTSAVQVSINPTAVSLGVSATRQFTASVTGRSNTAVTWALTGPGTLSASGLYTAPSTITSGQSATVKATSVADPSRSASATVTLVAPATPVSVTLTPSVATVNAAKTQQFTSAVTGTTNTAVTWQLAGLGTVSNTGLYSAPSSVASPSTVMVTATSAADPSKSGSATITLNPTVTIAITPSYALVRPGQQVQFSTAVNWTSNTAVTWTLVGQGTLVNGLYTAPANLPSIATATVIATSVADPSRKAIASLTLKP